MRAFAASCLVLAVLGAAGLCGCSTYLDDLNRSERHYAANEHEQALALLRVLQADQDSFNDTEFARYCYLRGMTDYRLSQRRDARHWLGLALVTDEEHPNSLQAEWKERLDKAMTDLNRDVFATGGAADSTTESSPASGTPARSSRPSKPSDD